jgi:hypothetical protein
MLPMFIGNFIEFTVAMRRIQKFLCCPEINSSIISKESKTITGDALKIQGNVNFHWGVNMEAKE